MAIGIRNALRASMSVLEGIFLLSAVYFFYYFIGTLYETNQICYQL